MHNVNATSARNEFFEMIRKGNAVLMSEDEYDSLIETLELLSIPGFSESMKRSVEQMKSGQTVPFDDVFGVSE